MDCRICCLCLADRFRACRDVSARKVTVRSSFRGLSHRAVVEFRLEGLISTLVSTRVKNITIIGLARHSIKARRAYCGMYQTFFFTLIDIDLVVVRQASLEQQEVGKVSTLSLNYSGFRWSGGGVVQ